jgi:hypothetical protein
MNSRQDRWLAPSGRDTRSRNEISSLWDHARSTVHSTRRQGVDKCCGIVRYAIARRSVFFNVDVDRLTAFILVWTWELLGGILALITLQLQGEQNARHCGDDE